MIRLKYLGYRYDSTHRNDLQYLISIYALCYGKFLSFFDEHLVKVSGRESRGERTYSWDKVHNLSLSLRVFVWWGVCMRRFWRGANGDGVDINIP